MMWCDNRHLDAKIRMLTEQNERLRAKMHKTERDRDGFIVVSAMLALLLVVCAL